jgi:PAP2 superfamily
MATTFASARRTATTARPGRLFAVRELAVMAVLFICYRQVRFLTRNHTAAATTNAHRVVGLERRLGMFTEHRVQDLALHSRAVIGFLDRYYVTVHFPLTALFVVWVLVRHRDAFSQVRTWLYVVTAAALAIHVAFPLAPPRMLTEHRFVDTLQTYGPRIYDSDTTQSIANQYAAMPSLHFGWAVIVAAGFVAIKRSRASLLAIVHPLITLIAIVATANHYWLDAVVAFALIAATACAVRPIADLLIGRSRFGSPWPVPSGERPDVSRCLDVSIASAKPQQPSALSAT